MRFPSIRHHKYGVSAPEDRTWRNVTYHSRAEMLYHQLILDPLFNAGQLLSVSRQPSFMLGEDVRYRADFLIAPWDGSVVAVDVKGVETPAFKRIKKLWAKYGQLPLEIVYYRNGRMVHSEVIPPCHSTQEPTSGRRD